MQPYVFVSESNLLQAEDFNGGRSLQIRKLRYDLHGHLAALLHRTADQVTTGDAVERLRRLLVRFGDLSPSGVFEGTVRSGYVVAPGAGTNPGVRRTQLALDEILGAADLWPALFARADEDWQQPLLQPKGGMDMVWQAFLAQRVDGAELRDRVRLEHAVTGMRYAAADRKQVILSYRSASEGAGEAVHDYVVVTGAPGLVAGLEAEDVFDEGIADLLRLALYYRGGKYGWQARSRFWESSDLQIFGGISWTGHLSSQIWYPSDGYNGPTGLLTGAYPQDLYSTDLDGNAYMADSGYRTPIAPDDVPRSGRFGSLWADMDHAARTEHALTGCEALHPGFGAQVYPESGLSISWDNQPFQLGIDGTHLPVSRPDAYARLIRPIDRGGRVYLAGDYLSYLWGWQEGAVRSAWWTLGLLRDRVMSERG